MTFKYWRMNSSWKQYYASMIKSINARMNFNACDHLRKSKNVMTNNNYRTMTFCFTLIHCCISKNRLNFFKFVNFETCRKRASNWSISKNYFNDVFFSWFFRFLLASIFCRNNSWIQLSKCMIMFLKNWCNKSIVIVSWMLIK